MCSHFGDFLDIPDRLQAQLDFSECSHISGIWGYCPEAWLGRSAGDGSPR